MSRITVQPGGADRRVPVENQQGVYFEQGVPREVYHTDYIKRRLRDKDLVEVKATSAAATTPAAITVEPAATKGAA